jgi:TPR repeat protein
MNGTWKLFAGSNKHFGTASVKHATSSNTNKREEAMTPTPDPRLADIIRRHQQAFRRRERQKRYEQKQQRKESLAAQGHADAQFNLGFMYAKGRGVPQDYGLALKWYRLAAAQGHAKAQSNLGVMYYKGNGVPQDYAEALKWFRLAAAHGNAEAQSNLGVLYYRGNGVSQDSVQAYKWFSLAAATFTEKQAREEAAKTRDSVAAGMTPAQIAEAQKLAREWKNNNS